MRLASAACVAATTLLFGTTAQAGGVDISLLLTVVGGTAVPGGGDCMGDMQCVWAMEGDTVEIQIDAMVGEGEAVTFTGPSFVYDPAVAVLDEKNSSEEAFVIVNGVLMSPIGTPGADIRELMEGQATGWELQTLERGGAPGAATFTIGVAAFTLLGGNTTFSLADAVGLPAGTIVGDGDFNNISELVMYDEIQVLPEPASALATVAALGSLGLISRRRRSC